MISFSRVLIPFSTRNVLLAPKWIGYTEYFIFGIRVAQVQKTEPWNE